MGTPAITAVRDLVATAEGVWIAHEGGVAQLASDGTGWRLHTVADGLPSNDVTALTQAPDGALWAGFAVDRLGFAQFDAAQNEWRLRRYDPQQEAEGSATFHPGSLNPRANPVTALVVRQDGAVWFGTRNGRVGGVAADGQLLDDQLDPLIRWNDVNALFEDGEQGLWIGSFNGRVGRYQAGEWAVFEPELARAQVRSVVGTAQAYYWLGTDRGIVFLAEGACGFVSAPDRRVLAVTTAVGTAGGEVWWGTSNEGALRQDTHTANLNWVSPLRARDVRAVAVAPDSSVWFAYGAAGQLLRYEPATGRGETLVVEAVEMEMGEMTALAFDGRGTRPWVGTRQGLLRPDGTGWQRLTTADGLADNEVVQVVVAGDGSLWVLTPGGVSWRALSR